MWQRARWGLVGLGARPGSQSTQRGGLRHGMWLLAGLPLWPGSLNLCLRALQVVGPYTSVRLLSHHIMADNLVLVFLYRVLCSSLTGSVSTSCSTIFWDNLFLTFLWRNSKTKANDIAVCDIFICLQQWKERTVNPYSNYLQSICLMQKVYDKIVFEMNILILLINTQHY